MYYEDNQKYQWSQEEEIAFNFLIFSSTKTENISALSSMNFVLEFDEESSYLNTFIVTNNVEK